MYCHVCHTLTCMSMTYSSFHWHACYMPLNTFPLPPAPCFLSEGKLPPLAPFCDKKQNLMKCPAYVMFYYDIWHCWCGVWIDHSITYQAFFPLGLLLLLETHSASGHAISSCWDRQAGCRDQMRKRFPGQYKKGRERQTVHRKHGGRTQNRSQHRWEHWPC